MYATMWKQMTARGDKNPFQVVSTALNFRSPQVCPQNLQQREQLCASQIRA
jgi:hypothetical protein